MVFCDLCGKNFVTEERMLAYKSYMHPMTIASLPCLMCEKIFESQLAFKKHTTALHRDLVCNECPKKLESSKTLRDHKKGNTPIAEINDHMYLSMFDCFIPMFFYI